MLLLVVVQFPFFTDATHADYQYHQYCISYVFSMFSFKSRMSGSVMNVFTFKIRCVMFVSPWQSNFTNTPCFHINSFSKGFFFYYYNVGFSSLRYAASVKDGSQYFVLLIITDGVISDMAQTKESIVNVSFTESVEILFLGIRILSNKENGLIVQALDLFHKYPFLPNRKSFLCIKMKRK